MSWNPVLEVTGTWWKAFGVASACLTLADTYSLSNHGASLSLGFLIWKMEIQAVSMGPMPLLDVKVWGTLETQVMSRTSRLQHLQAKDDVIMAEVPLDNVVMIMMMMTKANISGGPAVHQELF